MNTLKELNDTRKEAMLQYNNIYANILGLRNMATPRNSKRAKEQIVEWIAEMHSQLDTIRDQIIKLDNAIEHELGGK
jgi:spore maturation protein SpmA